MPWLALSLFGLVYFYEEPALNAHSEFDCCLLLCAFGSTKLVHIAGFDSRRKWSVNGDSCPDLHALTAHKKKKNGTLQSVLMSDSSRNT